jgi:hypothetical protein
MWSLAVHVAQIALDLTFLFVVSHVKESLDMLAE